MYGKLFEDIISRGSILLSAPFSTSAEEQLYRTAIEISKNTEVQGVIWVCYQHTPEDIWKKLDSYGIATPDLQFIDMISHMMGLKQENRNTIYCTSPTDYGCLSRLIDEHIDSCGRCLIIMDNLNAMMSYDNILERFIKALRSFNNRIPQKNSAILYIEISGACDIRTEVAIQTTMNCVIPLNGKIKEKKDIEWESFKNTTWWDVFSLNAPIMFAMVLTMLFIVIFLSSLLIYLILQFYR